MIRKFLILVAVMASPAFGQEMTYTDPTQIPIADQTYTIIQQQTPTPIEEIKNTGGTALTLYDDGVSPEISLGFDFYYYGNLYDSIFVSQNGFISFTSQANGCCSGNPLPYIIEWNEQNAPYFQYINLNNSIFAMWSDLADFNAPGNPYYQSFSDRFVVGWYGVDELGTANRFTYEITLFSNNDFMINYGAFDYSGPTGRTFTSGYQGDQAGESYQIYNGNDPSSLQNTTYLVQSSEVIVIPPPPPPPPEEPDPPIAPDCTINPYDPSCIINSTIDDEDEIYLVDETTGADDGSDDGSDPVEEDTTEELLAENDDSIEDDFVEEIESLEEMLADDTSDITDDDALEELVAVNESNAVYRELSDEEKANLLADAISKSVLENALSIAGDATTSSKSEVSSESVVTSSSTTKQLETNSIDFSSADSSQLASMTFDQAADQVSDSQQDSALDILETGRVMGQEALAATMSQTESSAAESLAEAETVAAASVAETESSMQSAAAEFNSTTILAESSNFESQEDSQQSSSQAPTEQTQDETLTETLVAETSQIEIQTQDEQSSFDQNMENVVAQIEQTQQEENQSTQTESSSAVEYTDMATETENFLANITGPQSSAEQEELEMSILQQSIASSQPSEDESNRPGFAEAEAMTIASDPALANAFNVQPNTATLELLGVLGSRNEEKSDAEIRAEQVVAANKEQQDAINANYMDADQSGIVAAIAVDADVSSYLSARLMDNNAWYKPEDIYKNVVIRDNVRGSYFLEKGNTDTYKKMVDEQYK